MGEHTTHIWTFVRNQRGRYEGTAGYEYSNNDIYSRGCPVASSKCSVSGRYEGGTVRSRVNPVSGCGR